MPDPDTLAQVQDAGGAYRRGVAELADDRARELFRDVRRAARDLRRHRHGARRQAPLPGWMYARRPPASAVAISRQGLPVPAGGRNPIYRRGSGLPIRRTRRWRRRAGSRLPAPIPQFQTG